MYGFNGYTLLNKTEDEDGIDVSLSLKNVPPPCDCGGSLVRNGSKTVKIRGENFGGKMVRASIAKRRYRCADCTKTSYQTLPNVDKTRGMTNELIRHIESEAAYRSHEAVAADLGLHRQTVREIFNATALSRIEKLPIKVPVSLGLDEIRMGTEDWAVIVNLDERTIVEILRGRRPEHVEPYFYGLLGMPDQKDYPTAEWERLLKEKRRTCPIKIVVMDIWEAYRKSVWNTFGHGCDIVVDRFHAVASARHAMEAVRKFVRKDLPASREHTMKGDRVILTAKEADLDATQRDQRERMFREHPLLADCYSVRLGFEELWQFANEQTIAPRLAQWREAISKEALPFFKDHLKFVDTWPDEIAAYFRHKKTNAATEAMVGKIRQIAAATRGYSYESLRKRILLNHAVRKKRRKMVKTPQWSAPSNNADCFSFSIGFESPAQTEGVEEDFGADIDKVLQDLGISPDVGSRGTSQFWG